MLDALQLTLTLSLNPTALLGFVLYVATACVLLALFQFAYTKVTPHNEWALIRANNTAAAVALGGAIIGFALPASNVIAYSVNLLDFVVWAVLGAFIQLGAFFATSLVLRPLRTRIENGEIAAGIYVAAVAITVGLINAACMTPSA